MGREGAVALEVDHVEGAELIVPRSSRQTQDRVTNLMAEVRSQHNQKQMDPARAKRPAPLNVTSKYCFRSLPGMMRTFYTILDHVPVGQYEERQEKVLQTRFDQRALAVGKERGLKDPKQHGKLLERVYDALGGAFFVGFTAIPGSVECFFQTDDEDVAALFRFYCKRAKGDWQFIYEERPQALWKVGELFFPDNVDGREAAVRYMVEEGISTMELTSKDQVFADDSEE